MIDNDLVTVTTQRTLLTSGTTREFDVRDGQSIAVHNKGSQTLFVGGADVTVVNGWEIEPGVKEAYDARPGEDLYAIVASGSVPVKIMRSGD